MIAITVQPGQTLSGIAAAHGERLSTLEADNPQFSSDWNLILAGQTVNIGGGAAWTPPAHTGLDGDGDYDGDTSDAAASTPPPAPVHQSSPSSTSYVPSSGSGGGSITDIPGVPSSFVQCVAYRESSNGANQAYNGGVYGIITASGINVNGQSLSAQKAAFKQIYDTTGPSAWAADGCPGT